MSIMRMQHEYIAFKTRKRERERERKREREREKEREREMKILERSVCWCVST